MMRLIGRLNICTNVGLDRFSLENEDDIRNFVPGLPIYFSSCSHARYPRGGGAIVVRHVDLRGAIIRMSCHSLSSMVPAVAPGDYIYVDGVDVCPTCGR